MSSIKLREGAFYRGRNRVVYGPLKFHRHALAHEVYADGESGLKWRDDGRCKRGFETPFDLVEEAPEYGSAAPDSQWAEKQSPDPVNRPAHYTAGGIECIDAIQAAVGPEQFKGYLRGNVLKYLWRYEHKGGVESLRKAQWYLDRLIQANA